MRPLSKLKALAFFPKQDGPLIRTRVAEAHFSRLKYLIPALALVAAFLLATDLLFLSRDPGSLAYRWYLGCDLGYLLVHLAWGLLLWKKHRRPGGLSRRVGLGMVFSYALMNVLWAALIAGIEIRQTGAVTTLVVAIMAVAASSLISASWLAVLEVLGISVFITTALLVPGNAALSDERLIFLFSLALLSLVIQASLFNSFVGTVRSALRLQHLNDELRSLQSTLIKKEKITTIGQLSAGLTHEINNPLGLVRSNVSALEQGLLHVQKKVPQLLQDPELEAVFKNLGGVFAAIREAFSRITAIIGNLSTFAREQPEGHYDRYDLNQGIENSLALVKSASPKNGSIIKHLQPLPEIEARGSEINQVLLNLLLNAAYAVGGDETTRGAITVTTWADDSQVYCEIANTGPPIPEKDRDKLFTPFFTTKPAGEGMGLGLSLSHTIIADRHHGRLYLLDGSPTTFRLVLPLKQGTEGSAAEG